MMLSSKNVLKKEEHCILKKRKYEVMYITGTLLVSLVSTTMQYKSTTFILPNCIYHCKVYWILNNYSLALFQLNLKQTKAETANAKNIFILNEMLVFRPNTFLMYWISCLKSLKVHKIEIFFGFYFEICIISLLVMWKY